MKTLFKKSRPTVHNQHKKFNPNKYGKVWGSIRFEHVWGASPVGETNQPVIGSLEIGGKSVELTFSEVNKIMETLSDAKHTYNVGNRLGRTSSGF